MVEPLFLVIHDFHGRPQRHNEHELWDLMVYFFRKKLEVLRGYTPINSQHSNSAIVFVQDAQVRDDILTRKRFLNVGHKELSLTFHATRRRFTPIEMQAMIRAETDRRQCFDTAAIINREMQRIRERDIDRREAIDRATMEENYAIQQRFEVKDAEIFEEVWALVEEERGQEQQSMNQTELEDEIGREYELEVEQIENELNAGRKLNAMQYHFEVDDAKMLDEALAFVEQERVQEQQRLIRTELEDEIGREYELEVEQIESELIAIQQRFEAEDAEMLDEALALVEETRMLQREAKLEIEMAIVDNITHQDGTSVVHHLKVNVGWVPARDGSFRELFSFSGLQQSRKVTPRETNNDEEQSESESTQSSQDLLEETQDQTITEEAEQHQQLRYLHQQMEADRAERANQERIAEELRQQMVADRAERANQERFVEELRQQMEAERAENQRRILQLEQQIPRERTGAEYRDRLISNKMTYNGVISQQQWTDLGRELERCNWKMKQSKKKKVYYPQEVIDYCYNTSKTQSDQQQSKLFTKLKESREQVRCHFDGINIISLIEEAFGISIRDRVENVIDPLQDRIQKWSNSRRKLLRQTIL